MSRQGDRVQETFGTLARNRTIVDLFERGVSQIDIAKLFTVNGHAMSRQQVHQIVTRKHKKEIK